MNHPILLLIVWLLSLPVLSARPGGERAFSAGILCDEPSPERAGTNQPEGEIPGKNVFFLERFNEPTEDGRLPEGWEIRRTASLEENPVSQAEWPHWFTNSAAFGGFQNYAAYIYEGSGSLGISWEAPGFTWAITPAIVLPDIQEDINLSYWVWFYNGPYDGVNYYSRYHLMVYHQGVWTALMNVIGDDENTNTFDSPVIVALNEYKGKEIKLAFVYEYNNAWQMAVDEVVVSEALVNDFGVRNLSVYPPGGILPGDEVEIMAEVYNNGNAPARTDVSLMINGREHQLKPTAILDGMGMFQRVMFTWTPELFGEHQLEIRLPFDEFNANNSVSASLYVNHYLGLYEDFENFDLDGLGFPVFIFPPPGWTSTTDEYIVPTFVFAIEDEVSAYLYARTGMEEHMLITPAISFSEQDEWIRFYVRGQNNNINVNPATYPGANPPGIQGYSSIQLKYAESPEGPWNDLGDLIEFKNVYDENDNLVQSANGLRLIEAGLAPLQGGTYHLAFAHTSSFALVIGATTYYSFVILDNIVIGHDPLTLDVLVRNPQGSAVGNAAFQVYDAGNTLIRDIRTKNNGRLSTRLLPGNYTWNLMALGYEALQGELPMQAADAQLELTLSPASASYSVHFNVTKPGGQAAENALIHISNFSGLTNAAGQLEVAGLAPGTYDYRVYLSGHDTHHGSLSISQADIQQNVQLNDLGTSVHEPGTGQARISLYPNPGRGQLNIVSDSPLKWIQVFDLQGRLQLSLTADGLSRSIDLHHLKPGLYIVSMMTEAGYQSQKFQLIP